MVRLRFSDIYLFNLLLLLLVVAMVVVFWDTVSLYNRLGCPETNKLGWSWTQRDPPVSDSWVQGLKVITLQGLLLSQDFESFPQWF